MTKDEHIIILEVALKDISYYVELCMDQDDPDLLGWLMMCDDRVRTAFALIEDK